MTTLSDHTIRTMTAHLAALNSTASSYRLVAQADFTFGGYTLKTIDTQEVLLDHAASPYAIEVYLRGYARGHRTASLVR